MKYMYQVELARKTVSEFLISEDIGTYYLPSVQRDFVWDVDEVEELIDSLLNGYPTGVITVLETNILFPKVPLIDIETSSNPEDGEKIYRYVLDGQQRLTSLLLIRDNWKICRNQEEISITPVWYNPDDGKLHKKGKREIGNDFSKLIRCALHKEAPIQSTDRVQRTLEKINKDFLNRPLGFFLIKVNKDDRSEDKIYKDMAEIFTRINRAGIKLGNLEMFLSFFAGAFVAKKDITDLYDKMKKKHELDLEPIIRFVFSNFDLTQSQISKVESFKKSTEKIKQNYSDEEIKNAIVKSQKAIEITMELLDKELGVSNVNILPSQTSLTVLFKYVLDKKCDSYEDIPKDDINKMIKWLVISSFNGAYSSQTDKKVENDIKIINKSDNFPLDDLLNSMDKNNIKTSIEEKDFKNIDFNILRGNAGKKYLFILYILLHKNNATDWTGQPINTRFRNLARHHILPKENDEVRKVLEDEVIRNHLGNLTFISNVKNEEIGDTLPEDYLLEIYENNPDVLKEHFIPTDKNLWKPENYEEFIKLRTDSIWASLDSFMKNLG